MGSKVMLIYTGGTIGMRHNPETGGYSPFDFENLKSQVPELNGLDVELSYVFFPKPIDSSDMDIDAWSKIANIIYDNYSGFDGFVVLHGTDTMAYSASALSFMLQGLSKPVVFTGSQLPIGTIRTDGRENLITSIEIAGAKLNGRPLIPEVVVCFENKVMRGNRTSKISCEHFDAFRSANYPNLAEAGIHVKYNYSFIAESNHEGLRLFTDFRNSVLYLKLFPGLTQTTIDHLLSLPNLQGVVLETYGSGNGPLAEWFIRSLEKAVDCGVVILNVTQCTTGFVEHGRYETSSRFNDIGIVSGQDITSEAAICKLMYLFGRYADDTSLVKRQLGECLVGEMTETTAQIKQHYTA